MKQFINEITLFHSNSLVLPSLVLHPEVAGFDLGVLIQIFGGRRVHNLAPAEDVQIVGMGKGKPQVLLD